MKVIWERKLKVKRVQYEKIEWETIEQCAERTHMSERKLSSLYRSGKLKVHKAGKRILFDPQEVDDFIFKSSPKIKDPAKYPIDPKVMKRIIGEIQVEMHNGDGKTEPDLTGGKYV